MFCHNCGKELENHMKCCPHCGAKQHGAEEQPAKRGPASGPGIKKVIPLAAVAVLLVAAVLVKLVFFSSQKLRPTDYISLKLSGLDTEGTASLAFDVDRFLEDIREKKKLTVRQEDEITELVEDAARDFSLSKSGELSNGDVVTVESGMDKKLLKAYGIVLENDSVQLSVEGLTEIRWVSLNDYISVVFSGFDGYGYSYADYGNEALYEDLAAMIRESEDSGEAEEFISGELYSYLYSYTVEVAPNEGLSNGDEVAVSISMENASLDQYGIRFTWEDFSRAAEGLSATAEVNLLDYLSWDFSGYDGVGRGSVSLDTDRLSGDLETLFEESGRGAYGALAEEAVLEDQVSWVVSDIRYAWNNSMTTELDHPENLTNGDTVTLTCQGEEEPLYLSGEGIFLTGGTREITVEGLEEPRDIDLAEALSVSFSGVYPIVRAEVTVDYDLPYVYDTSLGDMRGETIIAREGDVYSGEITYDEQELLEMGYRVTNSAYRYTISGLDSYELSVASVEDENLRAVLAELEPYVREKTAEDGEDYFGRQISSDYYWEDWSKSATALESARIVYRQEESSARNRVYLVYHTAVPLIGEDRLASQGDVYLAVCMEDVLEKPDGALEYEDYWYFTAGTAAELEEKITSDYEWMSDGAQCAELVNESAGEELAISLESIREVYRAAEPETEAAAGAISGEASGQAASVLTYEGHTYARYDLELTWDEAKAYCEAAGGHLATVTSKRESAVLKKLLENAPFGSYWLGATDVEWEGSWKWVTGEDFLWTNWNGSEPNNDIYNDLGAENYLETGSSYSYQWNDACGANTSGFILETEPETASGAEAVYLTDLTALTSYNCGTLEYARDSYGTDHFYSLYLNASERGVITYDLGGAYTRLTGSLAADEEADSEALMEIGIWGDGELIFSKYAYRKGSAPISLSIDVTGVETLSIQSRNCGSGGGSRLLLGEGRLYAEGEAAPPEESGVTLEEVPVVDASGYSSYLGTGMVTAADGQIQRDAYAFKAGESSRVLWNLAGNYTSFEAWIYVNSYACGLERSVGLEILLDGESAFEIEDYDMFQGKLPLSLDLTGAETMEIRTWNHSGEREDQILYLGDTSLTLAPESDEADGAEALREAAGPEFPEIPEAVARRAARVMTCGNYRYYLFDEPMSWQQALAFCQAADATLACPADSGRNLALKYLAAYGNCDSYWVGGVLSGASWSWVNGEAFGAYENWSGGQPDNDEGLEYLMNMYRDGTWNDWKEAEATGFIMEVKAVSNLLPEEGIALTDLEWSYSESCETGDYASAGDGGQIAEYLGGVRMNAAYGGYFQVPLNGAYETFAGFLSPGGEVSANGSMRFALFGDGRLLYEAEDIRKNADMRGFSVDVTGVRVLTAASASSGGDGMLLLTDALLTGAKSAEDAGAARLSDLVSVVSAEISYEAGLFTDAYGTAHDQYLGLNAGKSAYVLYNLNGGYTSFSGTLTAGGGTVLDRKISVVISVDGQPAYELDFEKSGKAVSFDLDVSSGGTLEIAVYTEDDEGETWIYLTDDVLTK